MNNELLILMLNAIRLEIRNLTLQGTTANTIQEGVSYSQSLDDALKESLTLTERSDEAARSALGL